MVRALACELGTSVHIITPADIPLNGPVGFSATFPPVSGRLFWERCAGERVLGKGN